MNNKRVIVDVDAGVDDAFALLILLQAEKRGEIQIEAITCTMGNTALHNVCNNVVRLLELAEGTNIAVYRGATKPFIGTPNSEVTFFGKDGFGDLDHETKPDLSIIKEKPAATAIYDIVNKNPSQITVACLGPLTNLALAMRLYSDLANNIKDIFIMGGNYAANETEKTTAEFNFKMDPEAAYIVFNTARCPITVLPWETCANSTICFNWRFEVLGKANHCCMEVLNKAEKNIYKDTKDEYYYPCDVVLIIIMLYPDEITEAQSSHNATIELHGSKRGEIILDHTKKKQPNVVIIEQFNQECFKKIAIERISES